MCCIASHFCAKTLMTDCLDCLFIKVYYLPWSVSATFIAEMRTATMIVPFVLWHVSSSVLFVSVHSSVVQVDQLAIRLAHHANGEVATMKLLCRHDLQIYGMQDELFHHHNRLKYTANLLFTCQLQSQLKTVCHVSLAAIIMVGV